MVAQKLLHLGPLALWTPLKKIPPLSFYWDLGDLEFSGVLLQPTHHLLFEGQLQKAFKSPTQHQRKLKWHIFVIFLALQID